VTPENAFSSTAPMFVVLSRVRGSRYRAPALLRRIRASWLLAAM
jgi:hypothetical protein